MDWARALNRGTEMEMEMEMEMDWALALNGRMMQSNVI